MIQCDELDRLKAESAQLFAEFESARDEELKILEKTDPRWHEQKKVYDKIECQQNQPSVKLQS